MFWVEVVHGGRFFISAVNQADLGSPEDFRGMRYLGSSQTFNIMALAAFLAVRALCLRKISFLHLASTVTLILIAILTKNRAALFSITVGFFVLLVFRRDFRQLLLFLACALLIGVTIAFYSSDAFNNATLAIESGLNPMEDETGLWRLALNGAAIEQGMETPLVGQGFGGYFYFVVPGMEPIEAPPHNQFVYLFLKTGIIGALLCFLILASFCITTLRRVRSSLTEEAVTIHSWLLVVGVSQLVYGLVYGFVPLFGFFVGCGTILQRVSHTDGNAYRQFPKSTV
jgi:O-antigen ligase